MTISLKHAFTSPKADGTDSTLVQPSNWNAEHTITLAAGKVLGRDTSGAGAMQELPLAFDTSGNAALSATGFFTTAVGTTAQRPGTPVTGMFRFNSSLTKFEGYNGTAWSPVGGGGATISDTAPASPSAGDLWWNSSNGQMYTYYNDGTSSQWVVANSFTGGSGYLPLTGGTITGNLAVSGTVSGSGAGLTSIPVSGISATGTPSSSTYLRGDGAWQSIATGSLTLLATLNTTSGTTQVASSLPTTYANLFIVVNGVTNSTSADSLMLEASGNNGSTWGTSKSINALHLVNYGLFTIANANVATTTHPCSPNASGQQIQQTFYLATPTAVAINALRFSWVSGYTFSGGTIYVYGWN